MMFPKSEVPRNYRIRYKGPISGESCQHCGLLSKTGKLWPHHAIFGSGRRKISDYYNLVIYLRPECHTKTHDTDDPIEKELRQWGQRKFEETHTREKFRQEFGRDYLTGQE